MEIAGTLTIVLIYQIGYVGSQKLVRGWYSNFKINSSICFINLFIYNNFSASKLDLQLISHIEV